jgi:hypothetical protein
MSDLTAENLRLRAALEPFAAIDADAPVPEWGVLKAWIGSARAALAGATSNVYGASTIGVLQDKLAAAEAALNDQVVRIRELQSPTGFREEDDGRVVFPLALHGEQAILTVQLAEPTWRHAIQWLRRKYGEDATDEVWAFYAARIADDLEAQERKTDA